VSAEIKGITDYSPHCP